MVRISEFIEKYNSMIKEQEEKARKLYAEIKPAANRLFSTEDGKIIARQMIRACRLFEAEVGSASIDDLQKLQAKKDFVNMFITNLVDRKVFLDIIRGL